MSPGRGKAKGKKKQTKKRIKRLEVVITNCASNPNELYLSKPKGDEVKWRSGDGGTYAIVFFPDPPTYPYGSPFDDAVFIVKPTGATSSGPIRGNANYAKYKYRVVGDSGCDIDPIIHIGP